MAGAQLPVINCSSVGLVVGGGVDGGGVGGYPGEAEIQIGGKVAELEVVVPVVDIIASTDAFLPSTVTFVVAGATETAANAVERPSPRAKTKPRASSFELYDSSCIVPPDNS